MCSIFDDAGVRGQSTTPKPRIDELQRTLIVKYMHTNHSRGYLDHYI